MNDVFGLISVVKSCQNHVLLFLEQWVISIVLSGEKDSEKHKTQINTDEYRRKIDKHSIDTVVWHQLLKKLRLWNQQSYLNIRCN